MDLLIGTVFILGYAAIAMESPLRINKTAIAVLLAALCWLLFMVSYEGEPAHVLHQLREHLSGIAEILIFLMGAMTIVELIDTHKGFRLVTRVLRTNSTLKLMWLMSSITFFLSAVLDNLTTAIVMVSLLKKLMADEKQRLVMASMVVIAANAGGAWSPIGDVTTTMLWIGGQITALGIIKMLLVPSLISLLVPLIFQSFLIRGTFVQQDDEEAGPQRIPYSNLIFFLGLGSMMFIPVFKTVTHLPPYLGMLFGLGLLWIITELVHGSKDDRKHLRISTVISRIDLTSILFFLGILLSVSALESAGILQHVARWLDDSLGSMELIVTVLGICSAIIDNVPLVAATMGMYPLHEFPTDHRIWEMIAYCAGTGGSLLIIGSAAGVVAMGMERIDFFWYLRNISFTALLGYLAGIATYLLIA